MILMTRGIQHCHDIWKTYMQTQWFLWGRQRLLQDDKGNFLKNPDGSFQRGELEPTKVQGALRPIQLWEYVFPKDGIQFVKDKAEIVPNKNFYEVLAMLNQHQKYQNMRPELSLSGWILRKLMGAKKVPNIPDDIKKKEDYMITDKHIPMDGMSTYPIGVREDVMADIVFPGNVGYYQESL